MRFQNLHTRRKRLRLKGYDYSQDNKYFVTICTHCHERCFGMISAGRMELNEYGRIADDQFKWLQKQYSYIIIPVWIIMPDHVHAIIEIDSRGRSRPAPATAVIPVKIKPLPELMGAYKTTTSKKIHLSGMEHFRWQRSYHDHIIRNSTEYTRIFNYIENNPLNYDSGKSDK